MIDIFGVNFHTDYLVIVISEQSRKISTKSCIFGKQFTIFRVVVDPEDIGGISIRKKNGLATKVMNETTSLRLIAGVCNRYTSVEYEAAE